LLMCFGGAICFLFEIMFLCDTNVKIVFVF